LRFKQNQSQLERLQAKLGEKMEKRSAEVDCDLHQDLLGIVEENRSKVIQWRCTKYDGYSPFILRLLRTIL
jgi:frataxin-like iron-binding protein CyaY